MTGKAVAFMVIAIHELAHGHLAHTWLIEDVPSVLFRVGAFGMPAAEATPSAG